MTKAKDGSKLLGGEQVSKLALRDRHVHVRKSRQERRDLGKGFRHLVRNLIHFTLYLGWIDHASDDKSAAEEETTHEL